MAFLAMVDLLHLLVAVGHALLVAGGFSPFLYLKEGVPPSVWRSSRSSFPRPSVCSLARCGPVTRLTPALGKVAEETPEPVGSSSGCCFDRQNYGMSLPDAISRFAERIPVLDARFFVTAVLTQRETGGNLAEALDRLASVIRDRFKLKRQVRVLSAHGRITGWILAFSPRRWSSSLSDRAGHIRSRARPTWNPDRRG